MFGVVLWSDPDAGAAVIWCQDQGDLAYYKGPGEEEMPESGPEFFDTGDLVEFDLRFDKNRRIVHNPHSIGIGNGTALTQGLRQAGRNRQTRAAPPPRGSADVIELSVRRAERANASEKITRRG